MSNLYAKGVVPEKRKSLHNYDCDIGHTMFLESPIDQSKIQLDAGGLSEGVVTRLAKPFLKWVGGKTQLIDQLDLNAPPELKAGSIASYFEPFIGGGSFFFHVAQNYSVDRLVIADSNQDLILAYWTIRDRVGALLLALNDIQDKYLSLSEEKRSAYYYETRQQFNDNKFHIDLHSCSDDWIERTAQLIFLNKTCFNGLFRVNASGLFNVAFGKYANPKICDANNLLAVSQVLERTEILLGDFSTVLPLIDARSFVYLDPPYRPLTATSNFTGYSSNSFNDADQHRLAEFCKDATALGAKLMISNSDPDNIGSDDTYYQDTYPGYTIRRAYANRMVNCKADKRGKITELIIMNYAPGGSEELRGAEEEREGLRDAEEVSEELRDAEEPRDVGKPTAVPVEEVPLVAAATEVQRSSSKVETPAPPVPPAETSTPPTEVSTATAEVTAPPAEVPTPSPVRRSGAALGAFRLMKECAEAERELPLDELCEATGWKEQTARTYVSKKWKDYLEPISAGKSKLFKVQKAFLKHTEQSFLAEFSQVLGHSQPQTVEDARTQALNALRVYADFLGSANQTSEEQRIRTMCEEI